MEIGKNIRLMVISTSTVYGSDFLVYIRDRIADFIGEKQILFIPYARPSGISYDDYTSKVSQALASLGIAVRGIHEFENPAQAIREASSIFTGGGNTFLLLKTLQEKGLLSVLKEEIEKGKPYVGTSAGSNLTGLTISTTNDMPIVYPQGFDALQILPFNINPHYLDPDPNSTHKGETRETRIQEFHVYNAQPVLGIREGSWLEVESGQIVLAGNLTARLFRQGAAPVELSPGQLSF
ncbi:Peptidase E [Sphingobacterium spiritivorum]|uniref:dipeptidase E n=1 Tax=Sphingobacterium spiritivorum TaxID=258 RepID=A0A380CN27_SPHSI|nr:dipeptidase PepE [Sphingobacterium spiritivorum]SUJ23204.1 Peptidase E [Sphingobacterium spiritivorum]